MLKLSLLKQYTKQVVSSPINAIRRVAGMSASKLESSPACDTFVKSHNDIFRTNPKIVLNQILSQKTLAIGKDAAVFPLPGHSDMVIRVEQSAIRNRGNISAHLKLIPIEHDENILAHRNLGIPLYTAVGRNSELYNKKSVTPLEALGQKDNIMVLRKVSGKHPTADVFDALMELMGCTYEHPDCTQYINFNQLGKVKGKYGYEAAQKCLDTIRKGGEQNIPEGFFAPGSEAMTFTNCDEFSANHKKLVDTYLKYIKDVSKMPKKAFKEAVDTILMDKNFLIDFQHTNNTFVDMKNQKFNFMDFEFNKSNKKYIYDNPVKEFRNVLTGKNFSRPVKHPTVLIIDPENEAIAKKYIRKITEKINSVTPDKFKIEQ